MGIESSCCCGSEPEYIYPNRQNTNPNPKNKDKDHDTTDPNPKNKDDDRNTTEPDITSSECEGLSSPSSDENIREHAHKLEAEMKNEETEVSKQLHPKYTHVSKETMEMMLNIDLNELDKPHKLAKWIRMLPKYKIYINENMTDIDDANINDKIKIMIDKNDTVDHDANCELISKFVYQTQMTGKHIKHNFTEKHFKEILEIIHDKDMQNKYIYNDFIWIWKIIKYAQDIDNKHDDIQQSEKSFNKKLKWIVSPWNRFEFIEQNELIVV